MSIKVYCASVLVPIFVFAFATEAIAVNSANISCGQPMMDGGVTVLITVSGEKVTWQVAGILKTDTPQQKATKIRAAAPPAHNRLSTLSSTVAGGTSNTVLVTSKGNNTISAMSFSDDTTGEMSVHNVFDTVPASSMKGIFSLSGVATGLDDGGSPSVVTVTASGVTATVNPTAGMTDAAIEDAIISQLIAGGVQAQLPNTALLAKTYPGLEGDGRVILIENIDVSGLTTQSTDTGLVVDLSGMIDATVPPIPTVSTWGIVAMLLLVLVTGSIVFRRVSAKRVA